MTLQNINSMPVLGPTIALVEPNSQSGMVAQKTPTKVTSGFKNRLPVEAKNAPPDDPYYFALALIEEIDAHLSRPGGYYRVNGRQYSSLEGVIRAILGKDFVTERRVSVKRKKYPRHSPRPEGWRDRRRKLPGLDKILELYKTHTLKEIGSMYGAGIEAVRRHLIGTGAIEEKKAARKLAKAKEVAA
jgi:hypothetical protein